MRNAGLEETQAGIKIARRNLNNLRYADHNTLVAESEEELKSLLMKVKVESEKVGLKLNIQKTKIMAFGPITSWQIDGETMETVRDFFGGAWYAAVHGVAKSWTRLRGFTFTHWRRKWQPTPVFLPGESQRQRSLVGWCLWDCPELDTTEAT